MRCLLRLTRTLSRGGSRNSTLIPANLVHPDTLPVVTNLPASQVLTASAHLNGQIVSAGIDTPYTKHAKNYMASDPQLPPPVYAPDTVARAILYAAAHPERDIIIGSAGVSAWRGRRARSVRQRRGEDWGRGKPDRGL